MTEVDRLPTFPARTPADTEQVEFEKLWGPWAVVTPRDSAALLEGFDHPWWVSGGWAIDAFTGSTREHADIDVSIFRSDIGALRAALGRSLHIWSAGPDGLRPVNDQFPEVHDSADQVWMRPHAMAPWYLDVLLNPRRDGMWVHRREPDTALPLEAATWLAADGIRYLNPELVLTFKAKHDRPKDRADLDRTLPLLDESRRETLRGYLVRRHPDHDWLALL